MIEIFFFLIKLFAAFLLLVIVGYVIMGILGGFLSLIDWLENPNKNKKLENSKTELKPKKHKYASATMDPDPYCMICGRHRLDHALWEK